MARRELREAMEALCNRNDLQFFKKNGRYGGVCSGLLLVGIEHDGVITLSFMGRASVDGPDDDGMFERFDAMEACAALGVGLDWYSTHHQLSGSLRGVHVEVDLARLREIGLEQFTRLPQCAAEDLRRLGIEEMLCSGCGQPADHVRLVDWDFAPCCRRCGQDLRDQAPGGHMSVRHEVRWFPAFLALTATTAIGAFLWGGMQQPGRPLSFHLLCLLPVAWGCAIAGGVAAVAGGSSLALRMAIAGSILLSLLGGNIWGLRSSILDQQHVLLPWGDVAVLYFSAYLPKYFGWEMPFLVGGVAGCWFSFWLLGRTERIEIE